MSTYLITSLVLDKTGISLGHAMVLPVDNHEGIEAFRCFNLDQFDLILSSASGHAKNIKTWRYFRSTSIPR